MSVPVSRREFLKGTATVGAGLAAGVGFPAIGRVQAAKEPIKVGVLHSLSGTMAISEAPIKEVVLMAIDEINAAGGGVKGQAEAAMLGIARALVEVNAEFRPALKAAGLLKRDPRSVERKKFGHKKARRSYQFSKR